MRDISVINSDVTSVVVLLLMLLFYFVAGNWRFFN